MLRKLVQMGKGILTLSMMTEHTAITMLVAAIKIIISMMEKAVIIVPPMGARNLVTNGPELMVAIKMLSTTIERSDGF